MNKKEYLASLKEKLSSLPSEEVKKQIRTYRIKINTFINQGLTEEQALKKVGSVDLVSKKIINGISKPKKKSVKKTKQSPKTTKNKESKVDSFRDKLLKEYVNVKKELDEENKLKKEKKEKKKQENLEKEKNKVSLKEKIVTKYNNIKGKTKDKRKKKKNTSSLKEKNKTVKQKNVTKEKVIKEENVDSLKVTFFKQVINLIFLIFVVVALYFPFNMVNVYAIKTISYFGLSMGYIYAASLVIYFLYLIVVLSSVGYYLEYITDNKKIVHLSNVVYKVKRVVIYVLVVPVMLLVVLATMAFIMSILFYLDGLKIKGLPVAFFGLLLFICMIYAALRNKILKKEKSMYYSFFAYLIPLMIMGAGLATVYRDIKDYEVIYDLTGKYNLKSSEFEFDLPDEGEYKLSFNTNYHTNVSVKEDKKLNGKVRIELTYYRDYYDVNTSHDNNGAYISLGAGTRRKLSMFLENIRENKIYSFAELERYEVTIYVNKKDASRVIIEK